MRSAIDSAGRVVIPSAIRTAVGLAPNTPVEIRVRDGVVEVEAVAAAARVVRKGKLAVAVLDVLDETLKNDQVLAARDAVRGGRNR